MTRRLIVNADDFGLTPGVSAGILAAHRHGIVSSTTVLATAAIDAESLSALRDGRLGVPVRSQDEWARARAVTAGLRTADHFFGESGPGPYWSLARTVAALRALPLGVSEFMSHPGWCDDALAYSRYGRQRETEMVGLGTPAARAAAASLGIRLCHFGDL